MYFAGKLVYLIVRASNQLAVKLSEDIRVTEYCLEPGVDRMASTCTL